MGMRYELKPTKPLGDKLFLVFGMADVMVATTLLLTTARMYLTGEANLSDTWQFLVYRLVLAAVLIGLALRKNYRYDWYSGSELELHDDCVLYAEHMVYLKSSRFIPAELQLGEVLQEPVQQETAHINLEPDIHTMLYKIKGIDSVDVTKYGIQVTGDIVQIGRFLGLEHKRKYCLICGTCDDYEELTAKLRERINRDVCK